MDDMKGARQLLGGRLTVDTAWPRCGNVLLFGRTSSIIISLVNHGSQLEGIRHLLVVRIDIQFQFISGLYHDISASTKALRRKEDEKAI